jgi:hypothetical protein
VVVSYSGGGIVAIGAAGYGVTTGLLAGYNMPILVSFPGRKLCFTII